MSRRFMHTAIHNVLLTAATLAVVFGFLALGWDQVAFFWHRPRFDRAVTFEQAEFHFTPIAERLAKDERLCKQFMTGLGKVDLRRTFWLFAMIDSGKVRDRGILDCFSSCIEESEELLCLWSDFVRWRFSKRLWRVLGSVALHGATIPYNCSFGSGEVERIRLYGIMWFLGVSPLPPVEDAKYQADRILLQQLFLQAEFNPDLGRIETKPTGDKPVLLIGRAIDVSRLPLRGWSGPVPKLPTSSFPTFEVDSEKLQQELSRPRDSGGGSMRSDADQDRFDGLLWDGIHPVIKEDGFAGDRALQVEPSLAR